jgi:hypothetical protein
METTGVRPAPAHGPDAEALIKEARRRQHRRYAVIAMAAATLIAAAGGGAIASFGGSGHPNARRGAAAARSGRPAAAAPLLPDMSSRLVLWPWPPGSMPGFSSSGGPPAEVVNLDTGTRALRYLPHIAGGDYFPYLIAVGRRLVYSGGQGTLAIPADLAGRPRLLGRTPEFAPSASPERVWVWSGRNRVTLVPVGGGRAGPVITLPKRTSLVQGTDAGLLLRSASGALQLWQPGRTAIRTVAGPQDELFATSQRLVAYGTRCSWRSADDPGFTSRVAAQVCATMRVRNLVTGRAWSARAPAGSAGWVGNSIPGVDEAISPGENMIAAQELVRPARRGQARVVVLHLTGPWVRQLAVPHSAASFLTRTAWSAGGRWLFYQGAGGHMWAYRVATGAVRRYRVPCCGYEVMATVPDRPG